MTLHLYECGSVKRELELNIWERSGSVLVPIHFALLPEQNDGGPDPSEIASCRNGHTNFAHTRCSLLSFRARILCFFYPIPYNSLMTVTGHLARVWTDMGYIKGTASELTQWKGWIYRLRS